MTLKDTLDFQLMEFNHVAIGGTIKKAYSSNNNIITKKKHKYYMITLAYCRLAKKILINYIKLLKNI